MPGRRTAVLLLCAAAFALHAAAQMNGSLRSREAAGGRSTHSKQHPAFFWPVPIAERCWAPGKTPHLAVSLPAIFEAKAAGQSYAANPDLLFDGFW
jgi:hypothetical protein